MYIFHESATDALDTGLLFLCTDFCETNCLQSAYLPQLRCLSDQGQFRPIGCHVTKYFDSVPSHLGARSQLLSRSLALYKTSVRSIRVYSRDKNRVA